MEVISAIIASPDAMCVYIEAAIVPPHPSRGRFNSRISVSISMGGNHVSNKYSSHTVILLTNERQPPNERVIVFRRSRIAQKFPIIPPINYLEYYVKYVAVSDACKDRASKRNEHDYKEGWYSLRWL